MQRLPLSMIFYSVFLSDPPQSEPGVVTLIKPLVTHRPSRT